VTKLRVGIAGYGVVGKRRRQFVDANPGMKTVAVSDITFTESGSWPDGVEFFKSWEEMLQCPLDVLFVCVPNDLAPTVTIAGLERNMHVFCEKPPGRTVEDIRRVIDTERRHPRLKLKYGFNHRYHDSVREAKALIDTRRYGEVLNIRGVYGKSTIIPFSGGWRSQRAIAGGGILLDQGIHMLDMIRLFCGDFPEVHSFVSNAYWRHDVEDNAFAIMRGPTGIVAMVHSSATQWRHRFRLEITLRDALLELTGILSGSKSYGEERLTIVERKDGSSNGAFDERTTLYLDDHSWKDEIDEFASVIAEDRPVVSGTSTDALRVMELVYQIYHADEAWRQQFGIEDPQAGRRTESARA
jgi:predicted dehydrogenase